MCSWFHVWVSADSAFPEDVQRTAHLVVQEVAGRSEGERGEGGGGVGESLSTSHFKSSIPV